MPYNPEIHHKRSIRLKGFDYSRNEAYFVTVTAQGRECLFGEILRDDMRLNAAGEMVQREWLALEERFPSVHLDEYVFMPNHFHGIVVIGENEVEATVAGAVLCPPQQNAHLSVTLSGHSNRLQRMSILWG